MSAPRGFWPCDCFALAISWPGTLNVPYLTARLFAYMNLIASIPSPKNGVIHLGPLPLHAYGLMLAIGVVVGVRLSEPRAVKRGFAAGTISELATWLVVGGVIGARVYHLFTGYKWNEKGITGTVKIWEGGLSIWGAVLGGGVALVFLARRRKLDAVLLCDAMGPAVAVAQGIGRWGNWFNQELFGRPSTLPWALKIYPEHRPHGYEKFATFHPTFLYESLWCFTLFAIIVTLERRRGGSGLKRGQSFALYISLYTFERFWMELLRVDDATKLFGVRFNALLSALLFVVSSIWFVRLGRKAILEPAEDTELEPDAVVGAVIGPESDAQKDPEFVDSHVHPGVVPNAQVTAIDDDRNPDDSEAELT